MQSLETFVKQKAAKLGFDFCGIAKAESLDDEARKLEQWLSQNLHGKMSYMENYFDLRTDPRKLVPGAQSVIIFAHNYYPEEDLASDDNLKIAKYAYGKDYHKVLKKKLKKWLFMVQERVGTIIDGRVFVDSAPIMEKAWAKKSGVGWQGKNTNILNKTAGSFFFLSAFVSDLVLEPDSEVKDHCGTCTRCLDACPTDALYEPYKIDASRCISYLTIELKDEIDAKFSGQTQNWIFGCDICQDVCPWNRLSKPHSEEKFNPSEKLKNMDLQDWTDISEDVFSALAEGSAFKRAGLNGIKKNIRFTLQEKKNSDENA